jgi:tetratricopeptide (TPR) repeat protein
MQFTMKESIFRVLLSLAFAMPAALHAQEEPSEDCRNNYSIFYEFYRNKSYDDAFEAWKYTYDNCSDLTKNIYIFGPPIIKSRINSAQDEAEKMQYVALLLEMYDRRNELFPEKLGFVVGLKAIDMLIYYPDSVETTFNTFQKAIELDGYDHSAAFFNNYFNAAIRMFSNQLFTLDDVFNTYNVVSEAIEFNNNELNRELAAIAQRVEETNTLSAADQKAQSRANAELDRYTKVDQNLEKQIAKIATCSRLESLYNDESFEAHINDTVWLRRAAKLLQKERTNDDGEIETCTEMVIFVRISERLYEMDPSSPGARSMGLLSFQRKNFSKAAEYFESAANQEPDPIKAARDLNLAATAMLLNNQASKARDFARQAVKLRPNYGDAYITWAKAYAAADGACGNNVFEKKAVYWAALDKLYQARSVDPDVAGKVGKLISNFQNQLPNKTIAFELGWREGQTYNIGCWVGETVTVKFY